MAGTPSYATSNIAATCNAGAGATLTSTEGFDATYIAANLIDGRQSKVCKSNGSVAVWHIIADLGGANSLNCIAFCNHNWPTNTTVLIEASATGAFAGEQTTIQATGTGVAAITAAFTFAAQNFRYWRFTITPPANQQMQIGELWMCSATALNRQFAWGLGRHKKTRIVQHETFGGDLWNYYLMAGKRLYELTWQDQKDTDRDQLFTMMTGTAGLVFLFVLMTQNSNPTLALDQEAVLGSISTTEWAFTQSFYDINENGKAAIVEDGLGVGQ